MEDDNNTQQESGSLKKKEEEKTAHLSGYSAVASSVQCILLWNCELQDKEWLDGWIG